MLTLLTVLLLNKIKAVLKILSCKRKVNTPNTKDLRQQSWGSRVWPGARVCESVLGAQTFYTMRSLKKGL